MYPFVKAACVILSISLIGSFAYEATSSYNNPKLPVGLSSLRLSIFIPSPFPLSSPSALPKEFSVLSARKIPLQSAFQLLLLTSPLPSDKTSVPRQSARQLHHEMLLHRWHQSSGLECCLQEFSRQASKCGLQDMNLSSAPAFLFLL